MTKNTFKRCSYRNKRNTDVALILKAIENRSATKAQLNTVVADIVSHLETPAGTLDNYAGQFTKRAVPLLKGNYPEVIEAYDCETVVQAKLNRLANYILDRVYCGEKPNITPQMFALLSDYIKGRDVQTQTGPQYVVVGYKETETGSTIRPEPKQTS